MFFHGRNLFSKEPFFWSSTIIFENYLNINNLSDKIQKVSVIIPARNEEKSIEHTLDKLLQQRKYISEIILVNDQSSDKTVYLSEKKFREFRFTNFKIVTIKNLPSKWSGKIWALNQGVNEALKKKENKYLLFLDADISLDSDVINKLVSICMKKNFSMISIMAKLNCSKKWEYFFIPAFIFFFQKLYPFNLVNKVESKISAAAGGCMLCRSEIFRKSKVFEKIKGKIIDDCNLAKIFKKHGPIWLGLSNKVKSKREYNNFKSISKMVSRCAYEQLNNSIIILFFSVFGMLLIYVIPFLSLFLKPLSLYFMNFDFSFLLIFFSIICYFPTIKFYNINPLLSLTLPFVAIFYMIMTLSSASNYYLRKGNEWKGRKYS